MQTWECIALDYLEFKCFDFIIQWICLEYFGFRNEPGWCTCAVHFIEIRANNNRLIGYISADVLQTNTK